MNLEEDKRFLVGDTESGRVTILGSSQNEICDIMLSPLAANIVDLLDCKSHDSSQQVI